MCASRILAVVALSIIFLLSITSNCGAQIVKENNIDKDYEKCIAADTSSGNIGQCAFIAYDKWNKEMNIAYGKMLNRLKKEDGKTALKKSQEAWVSYRDAEFHIYDLVFDYPGYKWCLIRHGDRISIVRSRALQLRNYLEAFYKK